MGLLEGGGSWTADLISGLAREADGKRSEACSRSCGLQGGGSPRAQGTLQKFGGISPLLYPFSFLSPLDADQSRTI